MYYNISMLGKIIGIKLSKIRNVLFFLSFCLFFFIQALPLGPYSKLLWGNGEKFINLTSPSDLTLALGTNDAGMNYLSALELVKNFIKIGSPGIEWFKFSPPGGAVIEATLLILTGRFWPVFYILLVCAIWSLACTLAFKNSSYKTTLLGLAILSLSPMSDWVFGPGVFFNDGIASGLFILGVVLYLKFNRDNNFKYVFLTAVLFAVATLIRAQYLMIMYALIFMIFIYTLIIAYKKYHRNDYRSELFENINLNIILGTWLLFLSPWFLYAKFWLNLNWLQIVGTSNHFRTAWMTQEMSGSFWDAGYGWACQINQIRCLEIWSNVESIGENNLSKNFFMNETFALILDNPVDFIMNRLYWISRAWFSGDAFGYKGNWENFSAGILYILLILICLKISVKTKFPIIKLMTITSLIIFILAPFLIVHIEVRYLIFLKMLPIFFLGILSGKKQKSDLYD
jgi:hypothetical protein